MTGWPLRDEQRASNTRLFPFLAADYLEVPGAR